MVWTISKVGLQRVEWMQVHPWGRESLAEYEAWASKLVKEDPLDI